MKSTASGRPVVFLAGLVLLALATVWWGVFRPLSAPVAPKTSVPGTGTVPGTDVAMAPGVPAGGRPAPILVDDFETGQTQGIFGERKNRLDAFQGTWARRPSYTVMTKVLDTRPGCVGYSLRMEYNKVGGWCGWYTLLNGIDVSKHNCLTFWVKGERGGGPRRPRHHHHADHCQTQLSSPESTYSHLRLLRAFMPVRLARRRGRSDSGPVLPPRATPS